MNEFPDLGSKLSKAKYGVEVSKDMEIGQDRMGSNATAR